MKTFYISNKHFKNMIASALTNFVYKYKSSLASNCTIRGKQEVVDSSV